MSARTRRLTTGFGIGTVDQAVRGRRDVRRRVLLAALVPVLAAALAGWYALSRTEHHDYVDTAHCIDTSPGTNGLRDDELDYLAQGARLAASTDVLGTRVEIIDASGTASLADEYRQLGAARVERHGNLLFVWDDLPSGEQDAVVVGCLR